MWSCAVAGEWVFLVVFSWVRVRVRGGLGWWCIGGGSVVSVPCCAIAVLVWWHVGGVTMYNHVGVLQGIWVRGVGSSCVNPSWCLDRSPIPAFLRREALWQHNRGISEVAIGAGAWLWSSFVGETSPGGPFGPYPVCFLVDGFRGWAG